MATSGSTNLSTTRDELIQRALRMIGVTAQGDTPSATQTSEAAIALEHMVKNWMADGMPLWGLSKTSFSLVASTASYSVGVSQTINIGKPLRIIQAFLRNTSSNVDTPMRLITRDEYWRLGNKTSTGLPVQLYYDPQRATGTVYLYPTPDSTAASSYQVHFVYHRPYEDFDSSTNEPDFPQEWFEALAYGLAARLAAEYGISIEERAFLWKEAEKVKAEALSNGTEEGSFYLQPEWRGYY